VIQQAPTQTLVPPRPNLGPEPWTDGGFETPLLILTITAGLAAFGFWRRRRRRSGAVSRPQSPAPTLDDSPEARLLALCEQVRGTLSSRFGPGLRARTTEEIAVDPEIRQHIGAEHFERVTALLRSGDRLKFARQGVAVEVVDQLDDYATWATSLDGLPQPPRPVKDSTRRPPAGRTGRRSPRTAPPRSSA
jgi:hypothetical protein